MRIMVIGFLLTVLNFACSSQGRTPNDCQPPSHQTWTELLTTHVDSTGFVDYRGFVTDSVELHTYLNLLSNCPPNANWLENEKLAYWINVYNAFTIKLIIDYYPVSSIRDIKKGVPFINSVWDMKFFEIGGLKTDLTSVEHDILRKEFNEPRIHFAIVCASMSCPQLRNEAFVAERIDTQLEEQTIAFINDTRRNRIDYENPQISSIFKWFKKDFTHNQSLVQFLNRYSETKISDKAKVSYIDYDWSLNEK